MPKRRVLFFSLYFDPTAAGTEVIASVRPQLLARHLPQSDWATIVVTGGRTSSEAIGDDLTVRSVPTKWAVASGKARAGLDAAGLQQAGRHAGPSFRSTLRRLPNRVMGELATLIPDSLAWAVRASAAGVAIVRRECPDAIYSTSPSPSAHFAAWLVAIRTGLPWVAELRDLWSQSQDRQRTWLRRIPDTLLERLLFRRVSALVTVSEPLADRLRASHRRVPVHVVPTGFDPELYVQGHTRLVDEFRVLYAGKMYPERDLRRFLQPLANAIASGRVDPSRTRVELLSMGTLSAADRAMIRELGLEGIVRDRDFSTRDLVIDLERTSQVLLHLRWDDPEEPGILTGKLFEYLAARRPILSTGRYRDSVTDVLEETGAGVATASDEEAEAFLVRSYEAFVSTGRVPYEGREEAIERYDARRTSAAIAAILAEAVADHARARSADTDHLSWLG